MLFELTSKLTLFAKMSCCVNVDYINAYEDKCRFALKSRLQIFHKEAISNKNKNLIKTFFNVYSLKRHPIWDKLQYSSNHVIKSLTNIKNFKPKKMTFLFREIMFSSILRKCFSSLNIFLMNFGIIIDYYGCRDKNA